MTIQHILTLSIDAIALCFAAIIAIDFAIALARPQGFALSKAWCKSDLPRAPQGMRAETLAPIFEETELDQKVLIKEAQCPSQTFADIPNADTTPETVAIAATTRSTSPKQKKALMLPTSKQKKQSSVKPSTKQQRKPRNASASGQRKNTPLKKIPNQIDIVSNDIPSFSNALKLSFL